MVAGGVILMVVGILIGATLGGVSWEVSEGGFSTGGLTLFQLVGAGMGFIGFLVFIAGLAASPTPKQQGPVVVSLPAAEREPLVLLVCPSCGEQVPAKSKFCPNCGKKLSPPSDAEKGDK